MPYLKVNKKLEKFLTIHKPLKVAVGGRGCISGDTIIDTPSGGVRVDRFGGGEVYALTSTGVSVVYADTPVMYDPAQLYMVSFGDGATVECTDQHRFLTPLGWQSLSSVLSWQLHVFSSYHLRSSSDTFQIEFRGDVQHCFQTILGFLYCYYAYCRRYGQQPHLSTDTFLDVLQQLGDEQQHNSRALMHLDGQEFWNTHNPSQFLYHLSTLSSLLLEEVKNSVTLESCSIEKLSELILELPLTPQQSHERINLHWLVYISSKLFLDLYTYRKCLGENLQRAFDSLSFFVHDSSYSDLLCSYADDYCYNNTITSCVATSTTNYYDLFVPFYNNYISNGIINHNSGKSIGFGDILTFKMDTEKCDVYCLREYQESLEDSVHRVFRESIEDRLQLDGWTIKERKVVSPAGNRTKYVGAARNPDSIQSAQSYKYSWFEEAHRASQDSIDKLLPTILRNNGSECWFSGNPQSSNDPFSKRFVTPYLSQLLKDGYYEDEIHYIVFVNWRDNPWWNESQEALRKWDFENLSRAKYDWIWEGAFNDSVEDSLIKAEWFDSCIDAHLKLGFHPRGLKMAAHDPSDEGTDSKGYAMRHGSVVLDVQEKTTGDINDGCDWALNLAIQQKVDAFTWDCDGLGVGLKRDVHEALDGKNRIVSMFKGSESPDFPEAIYEPVEGSQIQDQRTNKDLLKNKRAQYYVMLRDKCLATHRAVTMGIYTDPDKMISFSSDITALQKLRSEVCKMPVKHNPNGMIQLYTKPEMKTKFKFDSPNLADPVMMLMRAPHQVHRNNIPRPKPIRVIRTR